MFCDIYTSINDEMTNKINIKIENIVCLNTSILIFSFLLSCIMDLYNFIPLTASAIVHGITIIFLKNIVERNKIIPLPVPNTYIIEDNV